MVLEKQSLQNGPKEMLAFEEASLDQVEIFKKMELEGINNNTVAEYFDNHATYWWNMLQDSTPNSSYQLLGKEVRAVLLSPGTTDATVKIHGSKDFLQTHQAMWNTVAREERASGKAIHGEHLALEALRQVEVIKDAVKRGEPIPDEYQRAYCQAVRNIENTQEFELELSPDRREELMCFLHSLRIIEMPEEEDRKLLSSSTRKELREALSNHELGIAASEVLPVLNKMGAEQIVLRDNGDIYSDVVHESRIELKVEEDRLVVVGGERREGRETIPIEGGLEYSGDQILPNTTAIEVDFKENQLENGGGTVGDVMDLTEMLGATNFWVSVPIEHTWDDHVREAVGEERLREMALWDHTGMGMSIERDEDGKRSVGYYNQEEKHPLIFDEDRSIPQGWLKRGTSITDLNFPDTRERRQSRKATDHA